VYLIFGPYPKVRCNVINAIIFMFLFILSDLLLRAKQFYVDNV